MASSAVIAEKARELALPIAQSMGFDLIDAVFKREGGDWYLRVFIDVRGGIHIDDCERLSKEFSDVLDREDFIPQSYILEVSSPGLDRPLKTESDFRRYEGELIEVRVKNSGDMIEGTLLGFSDGQVILKPARGDKFAIKWEDVKTVKRAIKF